MLMQAMAFNVFTCQLVNEFYNIMVENNSNKYKMTISFVITSAWIITNIIKMIIFNWICERVCNKVCL